VVVKLSSDNIVFIGFMGCGKSTISREYAKVKNMYFLDTDSLIETLENRTINRIFHEDSELYFRKLELDTFNWIKTSVKNSIISTGGGFPVFINNFSQIGKIIYLKVDFENIIKRLSKDELQKRPLFSNIDNANKLFLSRDAIYQQKADIIIDANDTVSNIIDKIEYSIKII
jgi:shikimate kinase